MCGIAAIFSYRQHAPPVSPGELLRIRDAMVRRGPDGEGLWLSPDHRVGLAHRRLAIIDLTATGSQPMASVDGSLVVVFNGEIYNYQALRKTLEAAGHVFASSSDTEVLLHLYAAHGERMVDMLRGMFAFALWDARRKGLLLARDPFGVKPLYYADDGGTVRIASQVKALLHGGAVSSTMTSAGQVGFFLWGHIPEPFTLYRDVRAVEAGTSVWIDGSGRHSTKYFNLVGEADRAYREADRSHSEDSAAVLRAALEQTVQRHLIADVPVGVFLSSGLDSGSLTAFASRLSSTDLRTVTLGVQDYRGTLADETVLAELMAKRYATEHRTEWLDRQQFEAHLDTMIGAMDQPTVDGVNSYYISRAAASAGLKVVLSGLGGDELFGGYDSFRRIPALVKATSPLRHFRAAARGLRAVTAPLLRGRANPKYAGILEYGPTYESAYFLRRGLFMPWELPEFLPADVIREGWNDLQTFTRLEEATTDSTVFKIAALEAQWYMRNQLLRDTDWASMAHSVEVRVPLIDVDLWRSVWSLLALGHRVTKQDMAMAADPKMPAAITDRPKTGFAIPTGEWLSHDGASRPTSLRDWAWRLSEAFGIAEDRRRRGRPLRRRRAARAASDPRRRTILVYRIGQLGDTLVALPAIELIRRANPDQRMILLTNRQPHGSGWVSSWDVLGPTGWFDEVVYYDTRERPGGPLRALRELLGVAHALDADEVFNLVLREERASLLRDRAFFRWCAPRAIYHGQQLSDLAESRRHPERPEWRRLIKIADSSNAARDRFAVKLPVTPRDLAVADEIVAAVRNDSSGPLIAVAPGSKMQAKRWPEERFQDLGQALLKAHPSGSLIVLGGSGDCEIAERLCKAWGKRATSAAGRLTIYESAALLGRCALYVGNDTGTMHLAAAVGVPCVAIFSARDCRRRWEPAGEAHIVLRHDPPCTGCMLETCDRNHECLSAIATDEVLVAVNQVLAVSRGLLADVV